MLGKLKAANKVFQTFSKKKNYDIFVINADGERFLEHNWKKSETYCYKNQTKTIISDKHTRKYLLSNKIERGDIQFKVWGVN